MLSYLSKVASVILFSLIISCDQEDIIPIKAPGDFYKISSIEYLSEQPDGSELFNYDSSGILNQVDDMRPYAKRKEFSYNPQGLLIEVRTYQADDNELLSRDSIVYDPSQRIEAIYTFSINTTPGVPLSSIAEFSYDQKGQLQEEITTYSFDPEYKMIRRYHWKDNNIVQIDDLDGQRDLRHEFFYKFDGKINYKLNNPHFVTDPLAWSENNAVSFSAKDYTGLLDLSCNPCNTFYAYNASGLPIQVDFSWGQSMIINYQ